MICILSIIDILNGENGFSTFFLILAEISVYDGSEFKIGPQLDKTSVEGFLIYNSVLISVVFIHEIMKQLAYRECCIKYWKSGILSTFFSFFYLLGKYIIDI